MIAKYKRIAPPTFEGNIDGIKSQPLYSVVKGGETLPEFANDFVTRYII
jgi:hypothetical protein